MPLYHKPVLSVIVPIVNEAGELPYLFETLTRQTGIVFELIICDGGSGDEPLKLVAELAKECRFETHYIEAQRGRGRQMNAGARIARGELLMFLHADSRFIASNALFEAVKIYSERTAAYGNNVAAHFTLKFRRNQESSSLAYFFYEAKTCLGRHDCIRGDQGCLLSRNFFLQVGKFDESFSYLEDIKLADTISRMGIWVTLPLQISTSARRFEAEGLLERQIVNAVIVNSIVTGWDEFFTVLPKLYNCHPESGRLQLYPLFEGMRRLLGSHSLRWLLAFWFSTGRHVSANIWQLFFWLDVRAAFCVGLEPGGVRNRWTGLYGDYVEPVTSSRPFAVLTACAVWGWYRVMLHRKSG